MIRKNINNDIINSCVEILHTHSKNDICKSILFNKTFNNFNTVYYSWDSNRCNDLPVFMWCFENNYISYSKHNERYRYSGYALFTSDPDTLCIDRLLKFNYGICFDFLKYEMDTL